MGVHCTILSTFIYMFEIFQSENLIHILKHIELKNKNKKTPKPCAIPLPFCTETECLGVSIKHFHHLSAQLTLISTSA